MRLLLEQLRFRTVLQQLREDVLPVELRMRMLQRTDEEQECLCEHSDHQHLTSSRPVQNLKQRTDNNDRCTCGINDVNHILTLVRLIPVEESCAKTLV